MDYDKEIDPSLKSVSLEPNTTQAEIDSIRERIDIVDGIIASLLDARFKLTRNVGSIKAGTGMPILNESREAKVLQNVSARSSEDGITKEDVKDIFVFIMQKSRESQDRIVSPKELTA